jgi:pimeloyl-ACP methyl ester carboxylesterase
MNVRSLSLAGALAVVALGCGGGDAPRSYVLVHGAWMGAWAWTDVAAELRADGHDVTVVELPAHGVDTATFAEASFDGYVDRVLAAVDVAPRPVVLVGHSMGGAVITQAAERRPARIAQLVYVAGYLPANGESLFALAMTDTTSHVGPALTDDGSDGTLDIRMDALVDIFCADCGADARARLLASYRAEPSLPLTQPVSTTASAFGSVPRAYVRTSRDNAVTPGMQQRMIDAAPGTEVIDLDSDHSPMLSHAAALTAILESF